MRSIHPLAELGVAIKRYREFILFNRLLVLPLYLVAYHRYKGDARCYFPPG